MGSGNSTHHDGQVIAKCPDCGRTQRLDPDGTGRTPVYCGKCSDWFHAESETGDVIT